MLIVIIGVRKGAANGVFTAPENYLGQRVFILHLKMSLKN